MQESLKDFLKMQEYMHPPTEVDSRILELDEINLFDPIPDVGEIYDEGEYYDDV